MVKGNIQAAEYEETGYMVTTTQPTDAKKKQAADHIAPLPGQPQLIASPYWGPQEDEVSLIDIALVVLKHKWVLFGTFLSILLLGLLAITLLPEQYRYAVVLESGTYALPDEHGSLGERKLIEPVVHTKSKLETSIIPKITVKYLSENPDLSLPEFAVSVPKGANLVEISAKSTEDQEVLIKSILNNIADKVASDHQRKSVDVIEQLHQNVERMEIKVQALSASLLDQRKKREVTELKLSNLDEKKKLLEAQITRIDGEIEQLHKHKTLYLRDNARSKDALALLLIDNAVSQSSRQRDELEKQLHLEVNNEKAELQRLYEAEAANIELEKAELERAQEILGRFSVASEEQKESLNTASMANTVEDQPLSFLDAGKNFYPTRRAVDPYREIRPEGLGKAVKLIIVGIMAGFIALMMTFIAEFVGRVRKQEAAH